MIYLSSTCNKYFTYDSLINSNAMTPFRSNLDRFYSSKHINNYDIKILTDIYFSDHFPILLIYKNIDL
jgi:endonuclease/exonuclease/phosphatase family metal-dependent hydrolase